MLYGMEDTDYGILSNRMFGSGFGVTLLYTWCGAHVSGVCTSYKLDNISGSTLYPAIKNEELVYHLRWVGI